MKQIAYTIIFTFLSGFLYSQGNVNFTYSSDIERMKSAFISHNKSNDEIKGWRIQIITTDDRRKMESAIATFKSMYPGVNHSWNHVPPYYRVKVGAYENKMQLMAFLLDLKQDFSGVIPVVENIRKSELIGY